MQRAATCTLVQLPLRGAVRPSKARRAAVSCVAQQQRQRHQAAASDAELAPTAASLLALNALLAANPALADEVDAGTAAAADAAAASGVFAPLGITLAGWALVLSPVLFYGLFNIYRTQINPRAKFGDAIFIFAATILVANIVSIVVFKVRIF